MIAIFIIIIMAIALIGAAGYGIMTLMDSSGIAINIQRNTVRLDIISASIRAGLRIEDGQVLIPVSADLKTRLTPAIAPYSKTTWGKDIVYCPISPINAAGATELLGSGDYEVSITTIGGLPYVSGSNLTFGDGAKLADIRNRHIVALLISPDMNGSGDAPACSQVTYDIATSTFSVTGGDVLAVSDVQSEGRGYGRVFVIDPTGPIPPGAIAINSVESAASFIVNYGLPDATIKLKSGENEITEVGFNALQTAIAGRTLRIEGDADGTSFLRINYTSGSENHRSMNVNGNLELTRVSLKGFVGAAAAIDVVGQVGPAGILSMRDSSLGGLRVSGGKTALGVGATIMPSHSSPIMLEPISVSGGQLFLQGNGTNVVASSTAPVGVKVYGGDAAVAGPISMGLVVDGKPFETFGGGRVMAAASNASVSVNGGASEAIVAGMTFSEKVAVSGAGVKRNLVTAGALACAEGTTSCQATCQADAILAWGECGSADGGPLSGFGANDEGTAWTCRWPTPAVVESLRTVKAVCSVLP